MLRHDWRRRRIACRHDHRSKPQLVDHELEAELRLLNDDDVGVLLIAVAFLITGSQPAARLLLHPRLRIELASQHCLRA